MNHLMRYLLKAALLVMMMPALSSCKKFIAVPLPGNETFPEDIFSSDIAATSAMIAIYGELAGGSDQGLASGGAHSLCYLPALSADDLESYTHVNILSEFYRSALNPANEANGDDLWAKAYSCIYAANAVQEGLNGATGVTTGTRRQLEGEARFVRAWIYFYLVNLYGPVPLALTTDFQANNNLSRSSRDAVYSRILSDLDSAASQLSEQYPTGERIRPNRYAALALEARVRLYLGDWEGAIAAADPVIASGSYQLDSLGGTFLKGSREAIWQLRPNTPGINTWQGRIFILSALPGTGEQRSATLSATLLDSFEPGDGRRHQWVDSIWVSGAWYRFPYKYKIGLGEELKEYSVVLRLAELLLIRAEALAQLGDLPGARADLNTLRRRAALPDLTLNTRESLLEAVGRERRCELFTEWGHRWLDLKRTNRSTAVLAAIKGSQWQPADTLYPIPQKDIQINSHLKQNEGY